MSCVSQTMKTLQPFGDVPQKLTEQLRRSFVATRTFSQALMKGKQIIQRIVKVNIFIECLLNENIATIRRMKLFFVTELK